MPIIVDLEYSGYNTIHLPLSWSETNVKVKWNAEVIHDRQLVSDVPQHALLSAFHEEKLYRHFDKFIDHTLLSSKHIVLVDYTVTGRGLMASEHYLTKYFSRFRDIKGINVVALSLGGREVLTVVDERGWYVIELNYGTLAESIAIKLQTNAFKKYAKYGGFNVDNDKECSESIRENPDYAYFKIRLFQVREFSQRDFYDKQNAVILWAESTRFCSPTILVKQEFSPHGYFWLKTLIAQLERKGIFFYLGGKRAEISTAERGRREELIARNSIISFGRNAASILNLQQVEDVDNNGDVTFDFEPLSQASKGTAALYGVD